MDVLGIEPRTQETHNAANGRFFYTPEKEEGLVSEIIHCTQAFLEFYQLEEPQKPTVIAQVRLLENGQLGDVIKRPHEGVVVTATFHHAAFFKVKPSIPWQLTMANEAIRVEYSLNLTHAIHLEKKIYNRQGTVSELSLERDVKSFWESIKICLSTDDARKRSEKMQKHHNIIATSLAQPRMAGVQGCKEDHNQPHQPDRSRPEPIISEIQNAQAELALLFDGEYALAADKLYREGLQQVARGKYSTRAAEFYIQVESLTFLANYHT